MSFQFYDAGPGLKVVFTFPFWTIFTVDSGHSLSLVGNTVSQGFAAYWNWHYIRTPNFPGFFNQECSGYLELQNRLHQ
jgi:hypothetical protein